MNRSWMVDSVVGVDYSAPETRLETRESSDGGSSPPPLALLLPSSLLFSPGGEGSEKVPERRFLLHGFAARCYSRRNRSPTRRG